MYNGPIIVYKLLPINDGSNNIVGLKTSRVAFQKVSEIQRKKTRAVR